MSEITPLGKNSPGRRDDFFSLFFKNFLDDDFFPAVNGWRGGFRVDVKETGESYLVEADLPGIQKDSIGISYENGCLTIGAKRDEQTESENEDYVRRERHYGEFKRHFLINNVDEGRIDASFKDGVLKIILPKLYRDADQKKQIDIH
jgi:HSP20 family protein